MSGVLLLKTNRAVTWKALGCCHCNSGSRRDAEEALNLLQPLYITVFCLGFAVSGVLLLDNSVLVLPAKQPLQQREQTGR